MAQIKRALANNGMITAATRRAYEAARPAPGDDGPTTLFLCAVVFLEFGQTQPFAELYRIACHIRLIVIGGSANDLCGLRQTSGRTVEKVG